VLVAPVKAIFNHRRNEKLSAWMAADLAKSPVDRLIGFNKMPGLDVYYAADGCFEQGADPAWRPLPPLGPLPAFCRVRACGVR